MTLAERFLEKYEPVTESGCWLWTAAVNDNGYGVIGTVAHRVSLAHRVSWQLHKGQIPEKMMVLHKCDTPRCVNPDHLFIGSQAENVADMHRKGRSPYRGGEGRGLAKLTDAAVKEILGAIGTHREIAKRYGVDHSQVTRIKNGKAWRHVA